jgi:hypothetical protein
MSRNDRFSERIGAVFLPEADSVAVAEDYTPNPEGPLPGPGIPFPGDPRLPIKWPPGELIDPSLHFRFCATALKPGCYTLSFVPTGISIFRTRYRGTLRVEQTSAGIRFSGDLYRYSLLDWLVVRWPLASWHDAQDRPIPIHGPLRAELLSDEAADSGGTIPIYSRTSYYSYLKGTSARLFTRVPRYCPCTFTLNFDEFVYNQPATGFSGTFPSVPTRSLRFVLGNSGTPDLYSGEAFAGAIKVGTASIRWVSDFYRKASLQINTLVGAETPPAAVGATTMASIFADAGWEFSVVDGGAVALPAALAGVNINTCWSSGNLHTLMSSVPGYNPADLDSVWRIHLVAVPATLGCSRGIMFDSSLGADPNSVPREGSATFSRDGYPAAEVPDGMGGSHYDTAANQQQRNVPRAFLRSATHEVGHACNQIHQNFELGLDNSIMSPTPSVATVLGTAGIFPDQINLAFNDTVKKHLRHLPDPAVRPGAMDFFGSAIAAPEASDVAWLDNIEVALTLSADRVSLGEPVTLGYALVNRGPVPIPVPEQLDVESLTVRINVRDPAGNLTFMRPGAVTSCPRLTLLELEPGSSVAGTATLFWGREGFAFETPGRHVVEVIVLWNLAGVPVASSAERDVFVQYPVTPADNDVAALLLDPEVGKAVASGDLRGFTLGAERIKRAATEAKTHPAVSALGRLGLLKAPPKTEPPKSAPRRRRRKP